jgi:UDP-N-acetylglucosamine 2-epimerase (non-hydrolysing)
LKNICHALLQIALRDDVQIIYPVHPNPNVKEVVYEFLGNQENIFLVDPLDYFSFVYLMNCSYLILTDSGGIQEEAPSLGKPVLVMRNNTERPEAIDSGAAILVGTNMKKIVKKVEELLDDNVKYNKISKIHNPYGDGSASYQISEICKDKLL